jgi:hypothetical protein
MSSPETPIPELVAQTRASLQALPDGSKQVATTGTRLVMLALNEPLQARLQIDDYTPAEIAAARDVAAEVTEAVPSAAGLVDIIEVDQWRRFQFPHTIRALGSLSIAYDKAQKLELVGDVGDRGADFLTRIAGEHLVDMALIEELKHTTATNDPGVYFSPLQIAQWRAEFVPSVSAGVFRQVLHRLSTHASLVPNLLALARDTHRPVGRISTEEIINYRGKS